MSEQDTYNDFESLCAGYVLGALSDEDKQTFEKMLDNATPEQLEIYRRMVQIKNDLAPDANSMKSSDGLFDDIMDEISTGKPSGNSVNNSNDPDENKNENENEKVKLKSSGNILPLWTYKAVAAILLAAFLGLIVFTQQQTTLVDQQETQISLLQSELEQRNELLSQLETELEQKEELLSVLESREANLILMAGQETNPDGYGKIIWDPENERALLQVANLPEPPEDKDYQLWLIKDQQSPISAGIFSFEQSSTDLFYKIDQLNESPSDVSNTFAVTLEPKGGAPQPTGSIYLLGQQN